MTLAPAVPLRTATAIPPSLLYDANRIVPRVPTRQARAIAPVRLHDATLVDTPITVDQLYLGFFEFPVAMPLTTERTWQHALTAAGSGELKLLYDDPDAPGLPFDGNTLFRLSYKGVPAFTFLAEEWQHVAANPAEESAQETRVNGRGHLALLSRGLVYPPIGIGRLPAVEDRTFNWISPQYDDSAWATAHVVTTVGLAQGSAFYTSNWANQPPPTPWSSEFRDPTASILWANDGTVNDAAAGDVYLRQHVTIANDSAYIIFFGCDDWGELYIDEEKVFAVGNPGTHDGSGFTQVHLDARFLSAGDHVVAVHVHNDVHDPFHLNPAGGAWAIFQAGPGGSTVGLIAHSDTSSRMLAYPAAEPGMTPGQIMRLCIEECQARGRLLWLTWSFDDVVDSAGQPWTQVSNLSTKVGTDLLTFFSQEMGATYVDLAMPPSAVRLDAWRYGTKGTTRPTVLEMPTDPDDQSTGNLTDLSHYGKVVGGNALLIRWNGGWWEVDDPVSMALIGAREALLGEGAQTSFKTMLEVARGQLALFATPREEINAATLTDVPADDAYLGYEIGDTITVPDSSGNPVTRRVVSITIREDVENGTVHAIPTLV